MIDTIATAAEAAQAGAQAQSMPPVDRWSPPFGGMIEMRIARDGTWYYEGTPIRRERLVRLFSTILRREPDGLYCLVTPKERYGIMVDDVPFLAVDYESEGAGRDQSLVFRTNVGDFVAAGPEHPIRIDIGDETGEPAPYVHVRGGLEARITRSMYYHLVEQAEERSVAGGIALGVWSDGAFFPLGAPLEA